MVFSGCELGFGVCELCMFDAFCGCVIGVLGWLVWLGWLFALLLTWCDTVVIVYLCVLVVLGGGWFTLSFRQVGCCLFVVVCLVVWIWWVVLRLNFVCSLLWMMGLGCFECGSLIAVVFDACCGVVWLEGLVG